MVHGLGTWTMHERGLRLDSWACTVVVNLGSVKWYPNNVVDPRPHEPGSTAHQALGPIGAGLEVWDLRWAPRAVHQEATAPPLGCRACSAGFKHCTAQGSACCAPRYTCALHVHARKCRISYLNFLEFVFGIFRILSREGGDLHDQILSVISWKNKRKCQKMWFFWAFSWKMVKYFIEIFR